MCLVKNYDLKFMNKEINVNIEMIKWDSMIYDSGFMFEVEYEGEKTELIFETLEGRDLRFVYPEFKGYETTRFVKTIINSMHEFFNIKILDENEGFYFSIKYREDDIEKKGFEDYIESFITEMFDTFSFSFIEDFFYDYIRKNFNEILNLNVCFDFMLEHFSEELINSKANMGKINQDIFLMNYLDILDFNKNKDIYMIKNNNKYFFLEKEGQGIRKDSEYFNISEKEAKYYF